MGTADQPTLGEPLELLGFELADADPSSDDPPSADPPSPDLSGADPSGADPPSGEPVSLDPSDVASSLVESSSAEPSLEPPAIGVAWPPLVEEAGLAGQLEASLASPVHAYLFLGPDAAGKREAACVFAAKLIAAAVSDPGDAEKQKRSALRGLHPDFVVVAPRGRGLLAEQAARMIAEAGRKPTLGGRKIILVEQFHTAHTTVAPKILKTLEEPASSVVMLLLADYVRPDHVTVASRCLKITFPPRRTPQDSPVDAVEGSAGASPAVAAAEAAPEWDIPAAWELQRAHQMLVAEWILPVEGRSPGASRLAEHLSEDDLRRRFEFWSSLLNRIAVTGVLKLLESTISADWSSLLDGLEARGAVVAVLADEALELVNSAEAAAKAKAERLGGEAEDCAAMETSTERTQRQNRLGRSLNEAELRYGLAVMLNFYSAELLGADSAKASKAIDLINSAAKALVFNPNEDLFSKPNVKLLLVNLLFQLGALE